MNQLDYQARMSDASRGSDHRDQHGRAVSQRSSGTRHALARQLHRLADTIDHGHGTVSLITR